MSSKKENPLIEGRGGLKWRDRGSSRGRDTEDMSVAMCGRKKDLAAMQSRAGAATGSGKSVASVKALWFNLAVSTFS